MVHLDGKRLAFATDLDGVGIGKQEVRGALQTPYRLVEQIQVLLSVEVHGEAWRRGLKVHTGYLSGVVGNAVAVFVDHDDALCRGYDAEHEEPGEKKQFLHLRTTLMVTRPFFTM